MRILSILMLSAVLAGPAVSFADKDCNCDRKDKKCKCEEKCKCADGEKCDGNCKHKKKGDKAKAVEKKADEKAAE